MTKKATLSQPSTSSALQNLPVASIIPSSTNPRKTFDRAQLDQLTENIRQHGVLQPVLVRPISVVGADDIRYELVAGERRFRAAQAVGLESIPANVRELSDAEAMEIQVIENLQRSELHPLEEADGYQCLISQHGYSVEDLASKVGKSRAYIYGRLKFVDLPEDIREALRKDEITPSVALLVARIPDKKLQKKAGDEILKHWNGPMSHRDALEHIKNNYMLLIDNAPFDVKDEMLCPSAGSCMDCPKRTGKDKELFSDIQKDDLCTDPVCFENKKNLATEAVLQKFSDSGYSIIDPAKGSKMFRYGSLVGDKFLDLEDTLRGSDKPLKKMLPKIDPAKIHVVIDPDGNPRKLVEKAIALEVLSNSAGAAEQKVVKAMTEPTQHEEPSVSPEDLDAAKALAKLIIAAIRKNFLRSTAAVKEKKSWLALIGAVMVNASYDVSECMEVWFEQRGLKFSENTEKAIEALSNFLKKEDVSEYASAFADFVLFSDFSDESNLVRSYSGEVNEHLLDMAKMFDVDVKALKKGMPKRLPEKAAVPDKPEEKPKKVTKKTAKSKK